jgi:SAM-dependent methyltransferase
MKGAATSDFEFSALEQARNYRSAIAKLFAPHLKGDVLEIGAGIGQMLSEIAAVCRPKSLAAIEPDSRFLPALRVAAPNAEVWLGSEREIPLHRTFDAIYSVNVLEHIEDDRAALAAWCGRLNPGGALCLLVPARPELYAAIDRDFGHYRRYTNNDLRLKLSSAGFAQQQIKYFNFAGYFAWLSNFKLLGKRKFNHNSVRLFDRFVFPLVYFLERVSGSCPIGQSLVAIAKREPPSSAVTGG